MAGRDFSAELFGATPLRDEMRVSEEEDRRRREEAVAILEQERKANLAAGDTPGAEGNAREIARMQRTSFGTQSAAPSSGRDLSAELFGAPKGKDLSAELFGKAKVDYSKLEPTGAELDYTTAATAMEGAPVSEITPTPPAKEAKPGFFEQLKKSFVEVGIPQAEAGFTGLTVVAQADRIAKTADRLKALEAAGQSESKEAQGLRKTLDFYTTRQGQYFKGLAEKQAELSKAPVYAGVRKLSEAKTFSEGFKAFAEDPVNIVANLTAQSLPTVIPGLVMGVINPALGAATMGGSSFGVEFGGSLLEFAQEKGFDTSDPNQMAQFFADKDLLREGVNKAGLRAGIIGAGDLLLSGLASKTLVPKKITGKVAKNVTNVGAQLGAQAVGGGGFEAAAQIATEGKITKPGEVIAEAGGAFGTTPLDIYAQTRQAAREAAREAERAAPEARVEPTLTEAPTPTAPAPAAPARDVTDILQTIEEARQLMTERRGEEAVPPAGPPVVEPPVAEEVAEEVAPAEPFEIEPLPEQLAGEPMPKTPEVVDAERILDEMYAERDKIEEQKVGSLWAKVKGRLADSDVKDLGDKKRYTFLRAGKQKAPTTIADMVADGTLDAWLPFDMRHDAPNFDGQVSEEYIKDKLRNGDYTNFERRMAIDQIMDQAESYERLINEEFTLEEINREIQLAVDEQRQIDQALEEPAAEGPAAPTVSRAEVEEFLKSPTEAGLRTQAEQRARAEREAAQAEAAPPPEEFTLTGSERAADEAAARGQMELEEQKALPEAKIPGAKKSNKELEIAVEDNDWSRATEQLEASKNPLISTIGKMAKDLFVTTEINPRMLASMKGAAGGYSIDNNAIYLKNKKYAGSEHVVAHETVHALTIRAIRNPTKAQKAAVNRLDNLYRYVKTRLPEQRLKIAGKGVRLEKIYGLTNVEEFIAEGMSNPEFQRELSRIPYKKQTAWGAFTKAIADILGIKDDNALAELIAVTEEITSTPSERGEYGGEILPMVERQTETPEFKRFSRNAPLVLAKDALSYDFQTGQPFVAQSYHGTNAEEDFTAFDIERGGALTAADSARMGVFSTSQPIVSGVYAANLGMGRTLGLALGSKKLKAEFESAQNLPEVLRLREEKNKADAEAYEAGERMRSAAKQFAIQQNPASEKFLNDSVLQSLAEAVANMSPEVAAAKAEMEAAYDRASKLDDEANDLVIKSISGSIPQRIMPLFVRMNNPKVYDAQGKTPGDFPLSERIAEAKKAGHDGVVFKNIADPSPVAVHYVSFNPSDIKSATGNIGTFDPTTEDIRYVVPPPEKPLLVRAAPILFSADELNRPQFRAGVAAYKGVANIANKVLDKLYLKPASPELARAMRDMKAEINKVQNKLADVAAKLEKLPIAEREMISDVIEGELLAGVTPPKHVLDIAAAMQQMMREGADEAIRLDMLSPQAVQRWGDKYLPRFYQNKLRDDTKAWARAARALFARQPMMKGVVGRQFKGRGMFYTIDVNELPDWIAEGWEQRDPEFDPATSTETVVWRDYTREERENMGEIRDAMFRFVMGYNGIQRDLALGRLYESLADEYASKVPKEGYDRVPETKVEGTNAYRYGKLAGLYVPKEIRDHLALNDQSMMDGVYKIYRSGLAKWKEGKTVLNPVAHANNVLSNVTMAHFAGVSYWDGHKYVGAVKDLAKNSDMVKEADDVGLFGGTFSQEEFMGSMPPKLRQMANMTASSAAKLGDKIWDTLAYTVSWNGKKFGARPVMQWMYDGEDKFFRYVIYRDARLRGMDPKDARDYAQQFIFTYDDLPKGARLIRDLGMPFFGYTYKVVPVMLQTVAKYPWRFAAPASLAYAANAMMYAMAASLGGDEDDWWGKVLYKYVTDPEFRKKAQELEDEERKNLPPWLKGLSSLATPKAIRLWMDDATNLPLFLDISRIFPGGDLLDAENNAGGVAFLQPLTPNNPVLTTLVAMLANRDMFRGKDVVESTDTPTEKAAKQGAWLWKQITPAISVGNYHFDRAMNVIANITGKPITVDAGDMGSVSYTGVGKDGLPVQPKQALLQTMGVKVRPYDLEQSQEIEEGKQKKMIREIQFDMSRLDRLFDKGSISEEAYDIEYKKLEKKRDFLEEGLTVSGKEKK